MRNPQGRLDSEPSSDTILSDLAEECREADMFAVGCLSRERSFAIWLDSHVKGVNDV